MNIRKSASIAMLLAVGFLLVACSSSTKPNKSPDIKDVLSALRAHIDKVDSEWGKCCAGSSCQNRASLEDSIQAARKWLPHFNNHPISKTEKGQAFANRLDAYLETVKICPSMAIDFQEVQSQAGRLKVQTFELSADAGLSNTNNKQ